MHSLCWESLPDPLLVRILSYSSAKEVVQASLVCHRWNEITQENSLWRGLFRRQFKPKNLRIRKPDVTWKEEYIRLVDSTPSICVEQLTAHSDEVIHVSFSTSGKQFVTCSKDATLKIWRLDEEDFTAKLEFDESMCQFSWRYTRASKFNKTDTLLLVAGVISDMFYGEIAIFKKRVEDQTEGPDQPLFSILSRVTNFPYDFVGDWVSPTHFFSGSLFSSTNLFGGYSTSASLYMCQVEPDSPANLSEPPASSTLMNEVLRLEDYSKNYLRCIQVTDRNQFKDDTVFLEKLQSREERVMSVEEQLVNESCSRVLQNKKICLIFLSATELLVPHQLGFCLVQPEDLQRVPSISGPDHVINLEGHIVGLTLSPDQQLLFVNVRRFLANSSSSLEESQPIASEIEMRVVDLETLQLTGAVYTGHKGFTDSEGAFCIFIDIAECLVASGSEDSAGRIWDRFYGCKVAELNHAACVNACAFSPRNPEVLVSVSDDNLVKVWHSPALVRTIKDKKRTSDMESIGEDSLAYLKL